MAKKKKSKARDYRQDDKRKNNPPIGIVSHQPMIAEAKVKTIEGMKKS